MTVEFLTIGGDLQIWSFFKKGPVRLGTLPGDLRVCERDGTIKQWFKSATQAGVRLPSGV